MTTDTIGFDFDNPQEFSDNLPTGTYEGTIESAETKLRRDDGSTAALKVVIKVALKDIPDWGDTTRTISFNIPSQEEDDAKRVSFFGRNIQSLYRAAGLTGMQGRSWDDFAEALVGATCMWHVKPPVQSRNGGTFQNINPV